MTIEKNTRQIAFSGTVVEMFKDCNGQFGKILLHPAYINIAMQDIKDVHLGDSLAVSMDCIVRECTLSDEKNDENI